MSLKVTEVGFKEVGGTEAKHGRAKTHGTRSSLTKSERIWGKNDEQPFVCMCDPFLDIMSLIPGDAYRIFSMFKGGLLEWIINEEVYIK